jgi:hypothetical protein
MAAEVADRMSRWAIVSDGATDSAKLVDLLTVVLSRQPALSLVEREDIDRVLEEQAINLSGLVARAEAVQLGRLLPADALLAIEQRLAAVHLRLIETRSGIVLWDYQGPHATGLVNRLSMELLDNVAKLDAPIDERAYVAVMGFTAEDNEDVLQEWTYALPALLQHDLRMQPGCCVLERRQLHRLTREQELTDIELQLRGASILVEGGLRRGKQANRVDITLKLLQPDGTSRDSIRLESVPDDLPRATRRIATAIVQALNGAPHHPIAFEAEHFARRADWLISHRLLAEATPNAYAAATIDPTRRNLSRVSWIHSHNCEELLRAKERHEFMSESTRGKAFETMAEALREASAAHEYDARQLRVGVTNSERVRHQVYRPPDSDFPNTSSDSHIFAPFVPVAPIKEPASIVSAREALKRCMLAKYEFVTAAARVADTDTLLAKDYAWLLIQRLALTAYFESSPDRYTESVRSQAAEIERALPERGERGDPSTYVECLSQALSFGMIATMSASMLESSAWDWCQRRRDWHPETIQPLMAWLVKHPDPAMRLIACERRMWLTGNVAAGIEALQISQEHCEETKHHYYPALSRIAVYLLKENKLAAVVEPYLQRCEQTRDPKLLCSGIFYFVANAEVGQRVPWQKRLLLAYATANVDPSPLEGFTYLKISLLRQLSGDASEDEYNEFASLGPEVPEQYRKLKRPEGDWNEFSFTTLDLRPFGDRSYCYDGCLALHSRTQSPELLLLWRSRSPLLQRVGFDGELRSLEAVPPDQASAACRQLVTSSTAPAGIYWNNRYRAILEAVHPDLATALPSANNALRWHRGKLYFSDRGLRVYDPATGRTENLTNSLRLSARNALDATNEYWISDIRSDEERDRLYLQIQSRELGGIWQYNPTDKSLRQVVATGGTMLHWSEGKLLYSQGTRGAYWHLLDPETLQSTPLPGYANATSGAPVVKVGPYLISTRGELHTKDGKVHHFPLSEHGWEVVLPTSKGFVAAEFDDQPVRVWRFELNSPQRDGAEGRGDP